MLEIKKTIETLASDGFSYQETISKGKRQEFMTNLEKLLEDYPSNIDIFRQKYKGNNNTRELLYKLYELLKPVKTSFLGMTSTGVMLHFLSEETFPEELFTDTDERDGRILYNELKQPDTITIWLEFSDDKQGRRFYFDVPAGLEEIIRKGGDVLSEKERQFEKLSISLIINGILRSLTIKIDKEWIDKLRDRKVE